MTRKILIVDDERNIRRTFQMVLQAEGYTVETAETGQEGLDQTDRFEPDVVVLDVRLPDRDGIEVLGELRARGSEVAVIMISGHGTIATAVEATRHGAFDFLEKPLSKERLLVALHNALERRELGREVKSLRRRVGRQHLMIGRSAAIEVIREQIRRVGPTGARVLITGESGTGKELVARGLHEAGDRRGGPFVKVNCAAIPEELIESELFGAVKGAYTGATSDRDGKFLVASGGTLFLDEVGDMSLKAQAKVLRALQEGEIEKVGGSKVIPVDVRVLAATNKDLSVEVAEGRFREDLYFRLNVVPIHLPPLRDRTDDIALLAEHLLSVYQDENGLPQRTFTQEALEMLGRLPWTGNVREVGNVVERMAVLCQGSLIGPEDLAMFGGISATPGALDNCRSEKAPGVWDLTQVRRAGGLVSARQLFEREMIRAALEEAGGNISEAARSLAIDRTNLHKKISSYGLNRKDGS